MRQESSQAVGNTVLKLTYILRNMNIEYDIGIDDLHRFDLAFAKLNFGMSLWLIVAAAPAPGPSLTQADDEAPRARFRPKQLELSEERPWQKTTAFFGI